ncbi:MAG: bactofilin family protein [Methyloligellaceae bacterium]
MTEGPVETAELPQSVNAPAPVTAIPRASAPPEPTPLPQSLSVIGEDVTITGTMTSKGEIQIDGQVQGDITCNAVTIGANANVQGGVLADQVYVRGRVNGAIYGSKVTLRAKSHIDGDIYHQLLSIEEGAHFEGLSRRSDDPKTLVQVAREQRGDGAAANGRSAAPSDGKAGRRKRTAA